MIAAVNGILDVTPVTVTTSATQLLTEAQGNTSDLRAVCFSFSAPVYFGGKSVSANSPLYPAGMPIWIGHTRGSDFWAMTPSGTATASIQLGVGG